MREFLDGRVTLHAGDCRDVIATLPDCSIDSVVTDPPYALVSISKRFGKDGAAPAKAGKTGAYARASSGFMGKQWDTGEAAFADEFWAQVLRVLKPGGHVLAFGGTRTYHRLACAIEDAGFEIRDQIGWAYGSGFPKSHNLGDGWGTALKPAWEPICMARKALAGTNKENMALHGVGGLNIDACRIEASGRPAREVAALRDGVIYAGNSLLGRVDGSLQSSKAVGTTDVGRWPANIIHDGSDEVVAGFPSEAGANSVGKATGNYNYSIRGQVPSDKPFDYADSGSAARFFYCAKTTTDERGEGNNHPTVKPVALMRWLVRLITPPGGTVLDPFMGSGSTLIAADAEQFHAIGCELSPDYAAIAERRIRAAAGMFAEVSICAGRSEGEAA